MRLAAIVLAAGRSTRFGSDKLLADFEGAPLLSHAVAAACAAPVEQVVVVGRPELRLALPARVQQVELDGDAMSASLIAGLEVLGEVDGAFVFLGDMPAVPHNLAAILRDALAGNFAAFPQYRERQGHPVLFARRAFAALHALEGDSGAGKLLGGRADVVAVPCENPGVVHDVDTPNDLENFKST